MVWLLKSIRRLRRREKISRKDFVVDFVVELRFGWGLVWTSHVRGMLGTAIFQPNNQSKREGCVNFYLNSFYLIGWRMTSLEHENFSRSISQEILTTTNKPIVSVAEEKEQDLPDNIDVPDVAVAPNKFSEGGKANSDHDDDDHDDDDCWTLRIQH